MEKIPKKIKYQGQVYRYAHMAPEKPIEWVKTGEVFGIAKPKGRTAGTVGDRTQQYVQYVDNGNTMEPVGGIKLAPQLHPGVYEIKSTMNGLAYARQVVNTDDLLKFDDPIHKEILGEMDGFWRQKEKYKKKGFLHNRAILMFGPPGSGKSCLIKQATNDLIDAGDIVFTGSNLYNLNNGLKQFREVEPGRRCLALLEDVDELGEHALLQLLDGTDTADNIMYLATTNYVNRLSDRILRPGRFDRKIEVPYPPAAGRKAYLMNKLADENLTEEQINELVEATDGFSFGHMREFVTGAYCMGQPVETVLRRLKGRGLEEAAK